MVYMRSVAYSYNMFYVVYLSVWFGVEYLEMSQHVSSVLWIIEHLTDRFSRSILCWCVLDVVFKCALHCVPSV